MNGFDWRFYFWQKLILFGFSLNDTLNSVIRIHKNFDFVQEKINTMELLVWSQGENWVEMSTLRELEKV